jgi:hypothetical protein
MTVRFTLLATDALVAAVGERVFFEGPPEEVLRACRQAMIDAGTPAMSGLARARMSAEGDGSADDDGGKEVRRR